MTERVPSIAFGSPPLTGASSISTPFSASFAAISRLTSGAIELMSMTMAPGLAPSITPFSPSTTSFTWGELGSMVMMMSVCSATALGVAATSAPAAATSVRTAAISIHDHQLVAGLEQVPAHRLAHDSQSDKSDFHLLAPFRSVSIPVLQASFSAPRSSSSFCSFAMFSGLHRVFGMIGSPTSKPSSRM